MTEQEAIDALRAAMKARKIKLADISRQIGVPYRSLQNWFMGKSSMPLGRFMQIRQIVGLNEEPATRRHPSDGVEDVAERFKDRRVCEFAVVMRELFLEGKSPDEMQAFMAGHVIGVLEALFEHYPVDDREYELEAFFGWVVPFLKRKLRRGRAS